MTERENIDPQQAELLWRYIDELKQADNPDDVHFVAVTSGERAEVVGLMETAAQAYAVTRAEAAPHCRRESIRRLLREAIASTPPQPSPRPAATRRAPGAAVRLPAWLLAPLVGRSTGWAVAVAALVALLWSGNVHLPGDNSPQPARVLGHEQTLAVMPKLIAGTLDPETSRAAWNHLNHCQDCLEFYQTKWRAAHQSPRRQGRLWPAMDRWAFVSWPAEPAWPIAAAAVR